ncbi:MAG: M1 family metallopeptidase [Lysobacteraceae bacterium]
MFRRSLLALATATALVAGSSSLFASDDVPLGRLSRDVVPDLVAVDLKIDPAQERFSGHTRIDAELAKPLRSFWLHGRDIDIKSATITTADGETLPLSIEQAHEAGGVLKATAPDTLPAGKASIDIVYEAPFGSLSGAYRVKPEGVPHVMTQFESLGARITFPGFDEPSFKQPWKISLTVPADQQGIANTQQVSVEPAGEGWKKLTFETTENLPSYLVAFAVGPWDVVKWKDIPPNSVRKTPLQLRGIAAKGQGGRMDYALENTAALVEAMEVYFDIPYPFDKLDILAAPDFAAGAMENPGLITYRDYLLFVNEDSPVGERQGYWGTHSHEIAHQWFGDLVTMPWWDDIWLNEAFATWMGNKIVHQLHPEFHTDRGLMRYGMYAMGQDSLASSRRVHEPIHEYTDIESAFDGITYAKGGAVLAMFERFVGEEPFRDAIRDYLRAHSRGNATSDDLIRSIAAHSDDAKGVAAAFHSFIDQPGVPELAIKVDCAGEKPVLQLSQRRYLPLGSVVERIDGQHWGIPLCVRYEADGEIASQCTLFNQARGEVALETDHCPAWVMPNADGAGYYRYTLDPKSQQQLTAAFDKLNEREQTVYSATLDAAFSAGTLDASSYLQSVPLLASSDVRETKLAPTGQIGWMIERIAKDEKQKDALRAYGRSVYGPMLKTLGIDAREGDSDEDRRLRSALIGFLAGTAKDPVLLQELSNRGRRVLGMSVGDAPGDGGLHPDAVPADQLGTVIWAASELGGKDVYDALEKHFRETADPSIRSDLLSAMGNMDDKALAERARKLVFEKDLLRRNELAPLLGAQSGTDDDARRAELRAWVDQHFDLLAELAAPKERRILSLYTANMCSPADAKELDAKFAQRMADVEGGPRSMAQAKERIQLCSDLREAQAKHPLVIPAYKPG